MVRQTDDFERLYAIVTEHLEAFVDEAQRSAPANTVPQTAWLRYLIGVFRQLYRDWPHDAALADYLAALERWPLGSPRAKPVHRLFRLAGHMYLHVAFDLTRGLAGTQRLPDAPHPIGGVTLLVPAASPSFTAPPAVIAASRPEARDLFIRAAPAFERSLLSDRCLELLGQMSLLARALRYFPQRRREQALGAIARWVDDLRSRAWIEAESIVVAPALGRQDRVLRLRQALIDAQLRVTKRYRVTDLELFSFPAVRVSAPLGLLPWLQTPSQRLAAAAVVLAAVTLWLLRRARNQQDEVIEAIDALGEAISDAMRETSRQATTDSPEAQRREPPRAQAGPPWLALRKLTLRRGEFAVLRELSFHVREGEVFGIVGPRGAGKSAVLQLIAGRFRSWQGEAEFRGQALARRHRTAIRLVSSDDAAPASTVYQWLLRGGVAPSRGMLLQWALGLAPARNEALRRRRSALRMLAFFGLDEHADWPVAQLAPALRWRVALAAAMAAEPKLLLIDEPTLELDAAARREMVQLIRRINQRFDTTIVLAEHDAELALGLCDRLIVMDQGRQRAEGAPGELASAIADAYRAEAGRN